MPGYLIKVEQVLDDAFDWEIRDDTGKKILGGSSHHPDLSRLLAEKALKKFLNDVEPFRCDICNSLQLRAGVCRSCFRDEYLEGKECSD